MACSFTGRIDSTVNALSPDVNHFSLTPASLLFGIHRLDKNVVVLGFVHATSRHKLFEVEVHKWQRYIRVYARSCILVPLGAIQNCLMHSRITEWTQSAPLTKGRECAQCRSWISFIVRELFGRAAVSQGTPQWHSAEMSSPISNSETFQMLLFAHFLFLHGRFDSVG